MLSVGGRGGEGQGAGRMSLDLDFIVRYMPIYEKIKCSTVLGF